MSRSGNALTELLDSKKTIVCVGSGGVGKTTVSASLALLAAARGRRSLVLTVDPARRLASSLGIGTFTTEERRVDDRTLRKAGVTVAGTLDAAMLDTKTTFDRVVSDHAPTEEIRERILANRFYRQASTALAGSQEYMAMEKLYEIREDRPNEHDLIVLDTPPSQHALDFLKAPERLRGLMDNAAVQLFLRSVSAVGSGQRLVGRLNRFILRGVGRFVGAEVFVAIAEFLESLSSMSEGFSQRSRRVEELLRQDDLAFLIVTSPESAAVDEALYLREVLDETGMPFGAFVVNRVHQTDDAQRTPEELGELLLRSMRAEPALALHAPETVRRVVGKVLKGYELHQRLARKDERAVARLREAAGLGSVITAPHFSQDIHDIAGLHAFGEAVVSRAPAAERPRLVANA